LTLNIFIWTYHPRHSDNTVSVNSNIVTYYTSDYICTLIALRERSILKRIIKGLLNPPMPLICSTFWIAVGLPLFPTRAGTIRCEIAMFLHTLVLAFSISNFASGLVESLITKITVL